MELIHRAAGDYGDRPEIVLYLDLHYDLQAAGLLMDTYGNFDDLTADEVERREAVNEARVESFRESYLQSLREVATERDITVFVGDQSQATETYPTGVSDPMSGDSWERLVWQDAHDRTDVS